MKGLRNVVAALAFVGASMAQSLSISTPCVASLWDMLVAEKAISAGQGQLTVNLLSLAGAAEQVRGICFIEQYMTDRKFSNDRPV
jgi:hypothetical protein